MILCLKLSKKKIATKIYTIKIIDGYNILTHSLSKLCVTYETETIKHILPYSLFTDKTLFYEAVKPLITHYNIDNNTYQNIASDGLSTKKKTIKSLEKDLISLYKLVDKFSDHIYLKYNVQVSFSLTIYFLAIKIFLTRYYKNNIPLINKRYLYEDIRKSYFGGIT